MKTSEKGIDLIKKFEGFRENAYQCAAGVWTIGYGHTSNVKKGDFVTEKQATQFLKDDLQTAENYVSSYSKKYGYEWNQNQFDALVSFTFNCGGGNLERLFQYGKRNESQIAAAFLLYVNVNGSPNAGLVRRRAEEKLLFLEKAGDSEVKSDFYPRYTGTSPNLDTILAAIGVPSIYYGNYIKRKPIAEANGITSYKGNYSQNMTLINLAKEGKLRVCK